MSTLSHGRVPLTSELRPAANGVFAGGNARLLADTDTTHWWYRSKADLVSASLPSGDGLLVDLGAGSGGVTAMLRWPSERKVAVDGNPELVEVARARHSLRALAADAAAVPLEDGTASVVTLLDVIEHMADPSGALREARRLLRPGGSVVVTVPGHRFLWSAVDEALGHERRYTRPGLRRELERTGFEVECLTHVFSWLLPPMWVKRRLAPGGEPELGFDVSSAAIDRAARILTAAERALVQRVALPFGTSVLAVGVPAVSG